MAPIALYYPWMHFQDGDWLRLALLSWDGIVRLRPRDVDDRDSELVRQIRGETDLLREITPSSRDLETVADAFFELIGEGGPAWGYGATHALRRANPSLDVAMPEPPRFPVGLPSNWPELSFIPSSQTVEPAFSDPWLLRVPGSPLANPLPPLRAASTAPLHARELLWIYCGGPGTKMSRELRRELVAARLAQQIDASDPWVGLHPTLGSVYLAALADTVARHTALSPVTDDPRMHRAVGALDHLADLLGRQVSPALEDTRAAYVHLTLRAVIKPENLGAVPVSRLLTFRKRYAAELTAYRTHIDSLAAELEQVAAVENTEIAQAHIQALFDRTTKPQLDDLRRALRAFGVESTAGALGLKVDLGAASGTALGTAAVAGGHLAVGGAAVALTVVPYIAGRIKARKRQRSSSPVAYLLAAERTFNRAGHRNRT